MKQFILILCLVCLSGGHGAAAEKVITAACDPWPPFVDPSEPKGGLSLEIIRAAYATRGYTVTMTYLPWARAEDGVKNGKIDILPPTWMTTRRKKDFLFSDPYAVNRITFVKRADDPFEFKGLSSLAGKKIGIVRGYGYTDGFLNAKTFVREEANDFIVNVKKLTHASKRIDLTLEDEIVARVKMANYDPEYLRKTRFTRDALSENALYVASGLANPRHKEMIQAFNKGLATIRTDGTYKNILKKFGLSP